MNRYSQLVVYALSRAALLNLAAVKMSFSLLPSIFLLRLNIAICSHALNGSAVLPFCLVNTSQTALPPPSACLRCLGLLAVHNLYTSLSFFLGKTALRHVVHRDVTSSHLRSSVALAKIRFFLARIKRACVFYFKELAFFS